MYKKWLMHFDYTGLHTQENMNKKNLKYFAFILFFSMFFSGCGAGELFGPTFTPTPTITNTPAATPSSTPTITPTSTPTITPTRTPTFTPTITPTPTPVTISFDLEGGGTYQMLRFETLQEALTYIAEHAFWYQEESSSSRLKAMQAHDQQNELTPEEIATYDKLWKIPGLKGIMGSTFPQHERQFFTFFISQLDNGTMLTFESIENEKSFIYVDVDPESVQKMMGVISPDDFVKCMNEGGTWESCHKPSIEISTPTLLP